MIRAARWATVAVAAIAAVGLAAAGATAQVTGEATLNGRVEHGAANADFDPTTLIVTLNVLEGITAFDPVSVRPAADGSFTFEVIEAPSRIFFLAVDYEGSTYSASLRSGELDQTAVITVYESTHDASVLKFDSYWVVVNGAVPEDGWVEIEERARVSNRSGKTLLFDSDAEGPAMLSFLRFALPPGAHDLTVGSSIAGGTVLEVDRGFALTAPVPPTDSEPHAVNFVYRLDYDGDALDLSRTMRFGAESFIYVAPEDVGVLHSPRLDDLGATDIGGRSFGLMEGAGIEPAERVELRISGLPQPTAWTRITRAVGGWYLTIGVPAILAASLALLLVYGVRQGRSGARLAANLDPTDRRRALLAEAAALEARLRDGTVSRRRYNAERGNLKGLLLDLELAEHMRDGERSGDEETEASRVRLG